MNTPQMNCRVEVDHPVAIVGSDGNGFLVDLDPDRPAYITTDGVAVWIERKVQKTRFLDVNGVQVGPVHANFVPAIVWAAAQGWRDPSAPDWFNDAVIAEVAAGGAPDDRHAS